PRIPVDRVLRVLEEVRARLVRESVHAGSLAAAKMQAMGLAVLEGVRVVDVTTSFAGPYCTQVLAALGAEVIKVEPPGSGDEARTWGPPFVDGEGVLFLAANAGKRSLALDLRRG